MRGGAPTKPGGLVGAIFETTFTHVSRVLPAMLFFQFDYYNANFLNKYKYYKDENGTVVKELKKDSREMELKPSEHFQDTLINLTHSTLQVPVNIFKKGKQQRSQFKLPIVC